MDSIFALVISNCLVLLPFAYKVLPFSYSFRPDEVYSSRWKLVFNESTVLFQRKSTSTNIPFNMTHCFLSDRYDLCQDNTESQKPYCFSKHWKRIGWSTVSKAADTSINTSNVIICCSILCKISAWTLSRADWVEWPCLYAEDNMGNEQLCSMCSFCCDITTHWEILDTKHRLLIGL